MPFDASRYPDRVYTPEIAAELGKSRSTVVSWQRNGRLPSNLTFQADEIGRVYWTREQLEQAREWVNDPSRQRYIPHAFR